MQEKYILDVLSNTSNLYLKSREQKYKGVDGKVSEEEGTDFVALYRVDEVTFEEKAPRKEALENVIASINLEQIHFVYVIMGDKGGVSFYYGIARDLSAWNGNHKLEIADIGSEILKPSLQGNFRGSKVTELGADEKKSLLSKLDFFQEVKVVEGVPGINKDDEGFQSVDRLIDVMLGDEFAFVLLAKPMDVSEIQMIQDRMYKFYNVLHPLAKSSVQESSGKNQSTTHSETEGKTETKGKNWSTSRQEGSSFSENTENSKGTSSVITTATTTSSQKQESKSGTEGSSKSTSKSESKSKSESQEQSESSADSRSIADSTQEGHNTGAATTLEVVNRNIQDWIKYLDEVIFPRLDYGMGKGLYISNVIIMGKSPATVIKLESTIRSIYGGEAGNKIPLKAFELDTSEKRAVRRFQIPKLTLEKELTDDEIYVRTGCSQMVNDRLHVVLGNWISSKELSLLAGLPQKEVVGLALREEVPFGLNIGLPCEKPILLGHLIQNGVVLNGKSGTPKIQVNFDKSYFDKHIFVTGVTGSGKTTTCQKLLLESGMNFMVIEPAKTEYRILAETFKDSDGNENLLVFTLGKENCAPFRLNPFEFFEGESITARVDMIKASMEAAFDMEAAIPQILEAAIYECYEKKGWDVANNRNHQFANPYEKGVPAFPTLGELEREIEEVVKKQGFDERLKNDYIGSIKARLKGLTVGAKGLMLNTPRSIDFIDLLDKKVVLELENIRSASEKSLIMGFILTNLTEAIRAKYTKDKKAIEHITLVEEAHRLLSKFTPGDSMNKKQGIEMFSDMLAEVRKYGESLIIVDQIPNKLTPEVLKNTNTKIVHRIFAQDDKEAIGNAMALKDEQKEYLSYLGAGSAIMMNPGLNKAIQLKIHQDEKNNTERSPVEDKQLRERACEYYSKTYKQGILQGLETFEKEPGRELIDLYLKYFQAKGRFMKLYKELVYRHSLNPEFIDMLQEISKGGWSMEELAKILYAKCYLQEDKKRYKNLQDFIKEVLEGGLSQKMEYNIKKYGNIDYLERTNIE